MSLLCSACGSNTGESSQQQYIAQGLRRSFTLEEALETYPLVIKGMCVSSEKKKEDPAIRYEISVEKTLIGTARSNTITVWAYEEDLSAGMTYLFFALEWESVFSQESFYTGVGVRCDKDKLESEIIPELNHSSYTEAEQKILTYKKEHVSDDPMLPLGAYIHSNSIPEIYQGSAFAVRAKVTGVLEELSDRERVACQVTENLKGAAPTDIMVMVPLYSVTVGAEYYLLLNLTDAGSLLYIVSSPYSVVELQSEEAVCLKTIGK